MCTYMCMSLRDVWPRARELRVSMARGRRSKVNIIKSSIIIYTHDDDA